MRHGKHKDGEGEANEFSFPADSRGEEHEEKHEMKVKIVCHLLSRLPFSELRYMTPTSRKKAVEAAFSWAEDIVSHGEAKE